MLIPEIVDADTDFQMISSIDIAAFAVIAFNQPEKFTREVVGIAGDEISLPSFEGLLRNVYTLVYCL
ncbi:hypothetical protein [Paenibacillus tundrae]|uniref:hypothetical protein n=1 Tax=Paenibacillus tundrae TaxID=528187 RepID=UPI0022A95E8E|nr:hypothetical protein [Paenibacillus tundrae]MCZ1268320.1 hypothetical protein [Paenibacillus tundrae]